MGLFSHDNGSSNHTCPMPVDLSTEALEPFVAQMTFHKFNMILSGACTAFICLVTFVLMMMHATHLSSPFRQTKIMRICALLPLYSIFAFLAICFPNAYSYLIVWLDLFMSIALYSFFLLLCDFVSPNEEERGIFFANLRPKKGKGSSETMDGLVWFKRKWLAVLQYPAVAFLDAVVTCITQSANIYCLESNKPYFAHIWLNVILIVSVAVAALSAIFSCLTLKAHIPQHKPLTKLFAFKLIVGLTTLEHIIFTILRSTSVLEPTSKLTYADVHMGIQTLIMCIQLVPIACFFHFAYCIGPYRLSSTAQGDSHDYSVVGVDGVKLQKSYQGGFLGIRAWLMMCNPFEIAREIKDTFKMIDQGGQRSRQMLLNDATSYN